MTKLVGILNITPDSFSDGGLHFTPEKAVGAAREMIRQGAAIIDIGAESTRPGATALSSAEEWARLQPVLAALKDIPFSVDTRHAETASKALAAGAAWINDVSGFSDAAMVAAVKSNNCKLVFMNSLSVPASRDIVLPLKADAVTLILAWAKERIAALEAAGIVKNRLIFDPGIGFGKTREQSFALLRGIEKFKVLGVPILVGHSRKSFLGKEKRDEATLLLSQFMATMW